MNSCYVLSIISFIAFIIGFFQAIFHFHIFNANHLTFMILVCIIYFFTETLVIFFFVGTGVSVKEYSLDKNLGSEYHKRSISIKRKVYPPLLLNILFMIILFILVGAVDTYRIPAWVYYLIYIGSLIHLIKVKIIQNQCFRENTKIILDMSGIQPVY
ncbi:MAG: hypothetical protein H6755_06770 [Candidatus Omnitrophica bacterium]|nr:hypothetical protein [Candidatus Omnitrophota bacterium]